MELMTKTEAKAAGKQFYYTGKPCKHGHTCGRYVSTGHCYDCEKIPSPNQTAYQGKYRLKQPHKLLYKYAKARAVNKGMEFSITAEDIAEVWPKDNRCPVTGKLFHMEYNPATRGGPAKTSPTLDRIDNNAGYIKSNIAVISHEANSLKKDYSLVELETILVHMLNYINKTKGR